MNAITGNDRLAGAMLNFERRGRAIAADAPVFDPLRRTLRGSAGHASLALRVRLTPA